MNDYSTFPTPCNYNIGIGLHLSDTFYGGLMCLIEFLYNLLACGIVNYSCLVARCTDDFVVLISPNQFENRVLMNCCLYRGPQKFGVFSLFTTLWKIDVVSLN